MSRLLSSQPPVEAPGVTVRYPILGSSDYLVLTHDRRVWNPQRQRWIITSTWPRLSYLTSEGIQKNLSMDLTWKQAFANEIIRVPIKDKFDLGQVGFPGYWIVRDGRVWSTQWVRWLPQSQCAATMIGVNLHGRPVATHRLLALAFIPNPHGYEFAAFKDGNDRNITLENIEWRANARRPSQVLRHDPSVVQSIKQQLAQGRTPTQISRDLGVGRSGIYYFRSQLTREQAFSSTRYL